MKHTAFNDHCRSLGRRPSWPPSIPSRKSAGPTTRGRRGLRSKYQPLALNIVDRGGWIGKSARYWYRKSVPGGNEYWIADASKQEKGIAFDHAKLAAALAAASGEKVDALNLPFFGPTFSEDGQSLEFSAFGARWTLRPGHLRHQKARSTRASGPPGRDMTTWERGPAPEAASKETKASPDGKWEAFIRNYNVCLREKAKKESSSSAATARRGTITPSIPSPGRPIREARRAASAPGLSPHPPLCRVFAVRPAPAETLRDGIRQAG